jgi:hypothetical protein
MSTKLSKVAYNRMSFQAEEARDLGLKQVANGVFGAIGPTPRDAALVYSGDDLNADTHRALWKIASDVIAYHDITDADILEIDGVLKRLSGVVVAAIEEELGVKYKIGALEDKLPGQK